MLYWLFWKWHPAFRLNNLLLFWKSSFPLALTADFTIQCSRTASQRILKHWSAHSNVVLIIRHMLIPHCVLKNILNSDTAFTKHSIHNSKVICQKSTLSGYFCWWFCNDSLLGCKTIEVAMRLFITLGTGTKKNVNYRLCVAIQISSTSVKLDGSVWFEASTAT
jgi:hypothetical protein